MELTDKFFDYLKDKLPTFAKTRKQGSLLFTCPNLQNHKYKSKEPTATFIPGSNKINCFQCSWKGDMYEAVRVLESDKHSWSDAKVTDYLMTLLEIDMYTELNNYKQYNWSLVPIAKNSKNPIENSWTQITHYDKLDWIKWLNNGINIGCRTGEVSNIVVIDIDKSETNSKEREELIAELEATNTLVQQSPNGTHFVFVYDKELAQTVNLGNMHIDIRNDGGQIVISPSKIEAKIYQWKNLGAEIKTIPENIKAKLLSYHKVDKSRNETMLTDTITTTEETKLIKEGGRNDTLVSLGGVLINKLSSEDTEFVLSIINHNFMKPPLPRLEIKAMLGSLTGYKDTEEQTQEKVIYEYLKQMQNDVCARDIIDSLKLTRAIVDKYLSKFVKEGKAIRLARGRYQYREKIEWTDTVPEAVNEYEYKLPFFNDIAIFQDKDVLLLGARTNDGKTSIAMNMLRVVIEQSLKPFYIYSEAGSRFQKIAQSLDISGKFYHTFHENPLAIELESNAFSIIDWLHLEHKENTDTILKHLNNELQRKGGILVIFTQLKQDHTWFAPNLIDHYPTFAARYIQDNDNKTQGHWDISKIKEPRGNYTSYILPCSYDYNSKIFQKKDII